MSKMTFDQYEDIILAAQLGNEAEYISVQYGVPLISVVNIILYSSINHAHLNTQGNTHQ